MYTYDGGIKGTGLCLSDYKVMMGMLVEYAKNEFTKPNNLLDSNNKSKKNGR